MTSPDEYSSGAAMAATRHRHLNSSETPRIAAPLIQIRRTSVTNYTKKKKLRTAAAIQEKFAAVQNRILERAVSAAGAADEPDLEDIYRAIAGGSDACPELLGSNLEARKEMASDAAKALGHIFEAMRDRPLALVWIRHEGWVSTGRPRADLVEAKRTSSSIGKLGAGSIAVTRLGLFPSSDCLEGFVIVPEVMAAVSAVTPARTESAVAKLSKKYSSPVSGLASVELAWPKTSARLIAAMTAMMFCVEDPLAKPAADYAEKHGITDWADRATERELYRFQLLARCPFDALLFGSGFGKARAQALLASARYNAKLRSQSGRNLVHADEIVCFIVDEMVRRNDFRLRLPFIKLR
jgi:hypothetical protein